ncbi:hypothetical protein K435DRAFT_679200 [Dendrothele bispora CBS 962.96]|uniref:Uncharacterized protein n=1 Tax=Dendrothele bispora (strain CBS 962.96) TaxID=1314807 RepID=A0A4S8LJG3_DENBC|nr:hypothetical protein K435DRAFT_679200 [Dendrothele bispora CBS 962.96]
MIQQLLIQSREDQKLQRFTLRIYLRIVYSRKFTSHLQLKGLQNVVLANKDTFGLDGKLGNHDAKVEIHLKPGSQPVSLPPFPVSPANRDIMDKQD